LFSASPANARISRPGCEQDVTVLPERGAWLVVVPLLASTLYYALPAVLQENIWLILSPQLAAYGTLAIWLVQNRSPWTRLRLESSRLVAALRWGSLMGLALGVINLTVLLWVIPGVGGDISFLRETPHAQAPLWLMFPFGISAIAILVELNFRGFQMGRLLALFGSSRTAQGCAIIVSAFAFAWDPFMVHVFRSLHWMAFTDGVVWGVLLLRTRSLYATMAAHAVEVWILYAGLKLWF
jgi:membrane protease YdiL (CAAX protease family)